jgi:polysaccharide deacetylase family protein (PEP-CTERM system associated)
MQTLVSDRTSAEPARASERGTPSSARMWQRLDDSTPNALTCDVEDYFQVSAFEKLVPKERWNDFECRLPRNIDRVLQLCADAGVRGTFFTLGWVAERVPAVVRRIADAGHEIASHGMRHQRIWTLGPKEFLADVATTKRLLEDVSGTPVRGYRAPSWSLDGRTPWAHEILAEAGYTYSSSTYPIAHDHYGVPNGMAEPFYVPAADILEIPASTVRFAGRNWPAAGGGYFRFLPLGISLRLLRRARSARGVPVMFYFHPWELDPDQPRIPGADRKSVFRHYVNLDKTESRLRILLSMLQWDRMDKVFCRTDAADAHGESNAP